MAGAAGAHSSQVMRGEGCARRGSGSAPSGRRAFPRSQLQPFVNVNLTLRVKSNLNHTASVLHGSFLDAVRWAEPCGLASPSAPSSLGWWPVPPARSTPSQKFTRSQGSVSEVNNEFHFQMLLAF